MASLDERDITQITLRFLKSHYRQRQREGATVLSSDMRGAGGIIADGFLSFPQVEGEDFRATVEATSRESRHEVRYKVKQGLLKWDSAALTSALLAVSCVVLYAQHILPVKEYPLVAWLALLIAAFILTAPVFYFMLMPFRRYRYIYAIEQFKQYYADEQWVAIAEDVFPNYHNDRYYLELRGQCIYNGFGLLVVRENRPPIMQVTPSRQDLFKHRRKLIPLFSQVEIDKVIQQEKYPDWLRQFKPRHVIAFQRKFSNQMAVCLISLVAIAGVFYQESQDRPVRVLDYEDYLAEMAKAWQDNRYNFMPDSISPYSYKIDTPFVWPPPIRKDESPYLQLGLTAEKPPGPPSLLDSKDAEKGFIMAFPDVAGMITYDCSRLRIDGEAFVVQEGVYPSYSSAASRISELSSYGLQTSALWLGCFSEAGSGYLVFFGPVFRGTADVDRALKVYETQLGDNVLDIKLKARSLSINAQ
ncbi:MAG: hypothetical protein KDD06_28315 [Phaeodactylibacter sp.]|nr:hypothetical protein [Phaeodactylibacter sp.]MCB9264679.1 hypothetical protein [Lewinellaceae bacterium]MCB9287110.1 hypothetical protein [Lewinellaceae bacterium]